MTDTREDEDNPSGNHPLDARLTAGGSWNPLASFRKTISATQRMELLRMKIPVLPPEDFMDTADFQRARAARARRFRPLVVVISAVLLVLLFAGLRSWLQSLSPHRDASSEAVPGPGPIAQPPRPTVSSAPPNAIAPPRVAPPAAPESAAPESAVPASAAPASAAPALRPPALADAAQLAKTATPSQATPSQATPSKITPLSRRPVEANPRSVSRSTPAPPQPKTTDHPTTPEPAPSGINFWTQPR